MHKVGKKILFLLAVVTVVAHSIFPHIHLDDIVAMADHHHHHESPADGSHSHDAGSNQGNQHNIFSFAQLDEDFIPASGRFEKSDQPVQFLPPVSSYLPETLLSYIIQSFGQYNEHPPPLYFGYNLSSRGPPVHPLS